MHLRSDFAQCWVSYMTETTCRRKCLFSLRASEEPSIFVGRVWRSRVVHTMAARKWRAGDRAGSGQDTINPQGWLSCKQAMPPVT